jgi:hypothetical protein
LSGSINSLAQRRLVVLDAASPEFARSQEIETVVASATVAPGPELPDPPQVERDRRFYETGGVVEAEPEDRTSPIVRMDMEVSENTARLTRVERRVAPDNKPEAAPTRAVSQRPAQPTSPDIVPRITPQTNGPVASEPEPPATQAPTPRPEPMIDAPTIAGDGATTDHGGALLASNSRPTEQGELDIKDRAPAPTPMIELPISSVASSSPTNPQPEVKSIQAPASNMNDVSPAPPSIAPYYAVQLAAYRSRERAETAWSRFQNAAHGILATADHEVVSIAIEGKGLYFRLLTGKYDTLGGATQACNRLKSAGTDCLVRQIIP